MSRRNPETHILDIGNNAQDLPRSLVAAGHAVVRSMLARLNWNTFSDSEELLLWGTGGFEIGHGCGEASKKILAYLLDHDPQLVQTCFIVEGINCSAFAQFHRLGVYLDNQGWYVAYSPANYGAPGPNNRLTTVYKSRNLQSLLDQIAADEGGDWPKGKDILKNLSSFWDYIKKTYPQDDPQSTYRYAFPVFSGDPDPQFHYQIAGLDR